MNRLSPAERYLRDVQFAHLVDTLEGLIGRAEYTPTELREAVILAATRYAQHYPAPPLVPTDSDVIRGWDPEFDG